MPYAVSPSIFRQLPLLVAIFAAALPAQAAVVPLIGTTFAEATSAGFSDVRSASATSFVNDVFGVQAEQIAVFGPPGLQRSVRTTAESTARWINTTSGLGRLSGTVVDETAQSFGTIRSIWTYRFQALENGVFTVDYSVDLPGEFSSVSARRNGEDIALSVLQGIGTWDISFGAGDIYDVRVELLHNELANPEPRQFGLSFGWSIASVSVIPEPSSWALMIAGFGLAGVAERRRRATGA